MTASGDTVPRTVVSKYINLERLSENTVFKSNLSMGINLGCTKKYNKNVRKLFNLIHKNINIEFK